MKLVKYIKKERLVCICSMFIIWLIQCFLFQCTHEITSETKWQQNKKKICDTWSSCKFYNYDIFRVDFTFSLQFIYTYPRKTGHRHRSSDTKKTQINLGTSTSIFTIKRLAKLLIGITINSNVQLKSSIDPTKTPKHIKMNKLVSIQVKIDFWTEKEREIKKENRFE